MDDLTCKLTADLLPLYADDLLSPESRQYVEAHLKACDRCRAELKAMRSAPPLGRQEPVADLQDEDRIAAGLALQLKQRMRMLQTSYLVAVLTVVGLFLHWWKVMGWIWGRLVPQTAATGLLALGVLLVGGAIAAYLGTKALQRVRVVVRRWILAGLAVAVVWTLFNPGPVLTQQSMLWLRDCGGGQPYRTSGAVLGWYQAPGEPLWQRQQAYRVEYTCPAPGAAGGYTRHLRWAGARTDFTLEAGRLSPVLVMAESGRPLRMETPQAIFRIEEVLASWTQTVRGLDQADAETYYRVRLETGEMAVLLFDPWRGDWHVYDRQVPGLNR